MIRIDEFEYHVGVTERSGVINSICGLICRIRRGARGQQREQ